jgi:penicillin-binding protein 2
MHELANRVGFTGGSGAMMDIKTGEVIFSASYPEYNSQVLTDGDDSRRIASYVNDPKMPFLNKVMDGAYTPGSIVKPFMALAALKEKIIDPATSIYSSGQLVLPNPYDANKPTIFKDWKALGYMDMRHAIAQSCDVYFYEIGGGFEKQEGLGINRIYKYMHDVFGFGEAIKSSFFTGVAGTVPSMAWKKENFTDGVWRIGNTYHTSIGQYGFQVSPIQMLRAISTIPNDGKMIEPTILFGQAPIVSGQVDMPAEYFKIVREGMRLGAIEGTGSGLNTTAVKIATKTGTAELGELKNKVNSWVTGFFPYDNPRYSFVIMMERGPLGNLYGATYVMRQLVDWMAIYRSEYFQ